MLFFSNALQLGLFEPNTIFSAYISSLLFSNFLEQSYKLHSIFLSQQYLRLIHQKQMGSQIQAQKTTKIYFVIQKQVSFGQALYVSGNIPQLGFWQFPASLRLSWNQGHYWSGFVEVSSFALEQPIQYKYAVGNWVDPLSGKIQWEAGKSNRIITEVPKDGYLICQNVWNMEKITFYLDAPQDSGNEIYYIVGDCKQLGYWKKGLLMKPKNNQPKGKMKREYSYTQQVYVFRGKSKFCYSYVKKGINFELERSPKRKFNVSSMDCQHPNCSEISHRAGDTQVYDIAYFRRMQISKITKNIFLGSYIKYDEDFEVLRGENVDAIISIQTKDEVYWHCVDEEFLVKKSKEHNIQYYQFQIEDMSKQDFLINFQSVLMLLRRLSERGKIVYVHCTAGKYRSPQIVALYLVAIQNYTLRDAIDLIKSRHLIANPKIETLVEALDRLQKKFQLPVC